MTTLHKFSWQAGSSEAAKAFWRRNTEHVIPADGAESEVEVEAIAKFACIEDVAYRGSTSIPTRLLTSKTSPELFNSNLIRLLVQWKWHSFWRRRYLEAFCLHVVSAIFFLFFAANFGFDADAHSEFRERRDALDVATIQHVLNDSSATYDDRSSVTPEMLHIASRASDYGTDGAIIIARVFLSLSLLIEIIALSERVVPPLKYRLSTHLRKFS